MATCIRCNTEVSGFQSLFGFNRQTNRCKACEDQVKLILLDTRKAFTSIVQQTYLTPQAFERLLQTPLAQRIHRAEILHFLQPDGQQYLSHILGNFSRQPRFDDGMERHFFQAQGMLSLSNSTIQPQLRQITLLNIKRGKFFSIPHHQIPDLRLESDELCYLVIEAEFCRPTTTTTKFQPGKFVITSKKLHFLSPSGGTPINWNTIMSIRQGQEAFYEKSTNRHIPKVGVVLELSRKSGNGFYAVHDAEYVSAMIDTLVRIAKRQLVVTDGASRSIPQEVRAAVWQRDQGKCTQCGATEYLEYDHVIPFSKGGATSVNNLQLLCRKCNLAKSDRI
jgi:hypothetical protein